MICQIPTHSTNPDWGGIENRISRPIWGPTRKKMNPLKAMAGVLMAFTATAHAIEQPKFTVLQTTDVFEIRKYEPYVLSLIHI